MQGYLQRARDAHAESSKEGATGRSSRKVMAQKMPLTHSTAGGGGGGCYAVTWAKVKSFSVVLNEISAKRSQLISMRSLYMVTEKKRKKKKRLTPLNEKTASSNQSPKT